MKQKISQTTITKKDNDWDWFGKLLKAVEGKAKSERVQEFVDKDIKRLEKKAKLLPESEQKKIFAMKG